MPALIIPENKYSKFVNNNTTYIQKRDLAFRRAYSALWNYNYLGSTGSMVDTFYTALDGTILHYKDFGEFGEIEINGNSYSACDSETKRISYLYLDFLIKECMKNYNHSYSI